MRGAEPSPKVMSGDSSPTWLCRYVPPTRDAEHNEAARTKTISWVRLARGDVLIVFSWVRSRDRSQATVLRFVARLACTLWLVAGFPAPPTPRLARLT